MSEDPAPYAIPHCPRCEWRGCVTMRCEPDAPVKGCASVAGCHTHALCPRCGFEWISGGEVPPTLRTPTQLAISISGAFHAIVNRPRN